MSNKHAPKFAFFYMLSLVALIFMSLATGMIIFQQINRGVVDVLNSYNGRFSDSQLKFAISALVISAPIFYALMYLIYKSLYKGELDKDSAIRRWLTYFIVLVAAVVMIGWLIGTLNSFLDGELTIKFLLKAITALGISGSIFSFYLYDIKREKVEGKKDRAIKVFFFISVTVIAAVFISALFIVESPTETRNRKIDDQIIMQFDEIDRAVNTYFRENKEVPESLTSLEDEFSYIKGGELKNPVTKEEYRYRVTGDKEYELCTTFLSSNLEKFDGERYFSGRWQHDRGEQCIKQKIHEGKAGEAEPVFIR